MKELEVWKSKHSDKPRVYIEEFIEKYKDSKDQDIQHLINGLIDDDLSMLIYQMTFYKLAICCLSSDSDEYTINEYYTFDKYIEFYGLWIEGEYIDSKNKEGTWKYIDHDIEYYWDQLDGDIPLEKALLDYDFVDSVLEKGRKKCKDLMLIEDPKKEKKKNNE